MRIVTPEQRQRRARADRALTAAVAKYLRLVQETDDAREDLYRKVFRADQEGMRQIDIVARTLGLGVEGREWTREHVRRIVDKEAERLAKEAERADPESGVAAAVSEDPSEDVERAAAG